MNKKQQEKRRKLRLMIIIIMVLGMAISAIAPAFADYKEENVTVVNPEEERADIWNRILEIKEEVESFPERVASVSRTYYPQNVPSGFSFQYELRSGAQGEIIKYLQSVLNTDPGTRVANSGYGSIGMETTSFGPATRSALLKFQRKHGISATGIVGPSTRTALNKVIREGVTVQEVPHGEREAVKNKVVQMIREMRDLNERVESLSKNNEENINKCREEMKEAHVETEEEVCTMQIKRMSCKGILTYEAPNGCVISHLENLGWK